jgi:hypothetical protein
LAALLDVPGMTAERLESFYLSAATFYRAAPWRNVPGDTPIKVVCDKFETSTWYAIVMGQSGMTLGLALHEDLSALESLLAGQFSDREGARQMSAISVMFNEAFEISPRDLEAIEKHAWPVASPEAYPLAVRVNPGGNVRPPLAWEVELLAACLLSVPKFLQHQQEQQPLVVDTAVGPLSLAWI